MTRGIVFILPRYTSFIMPDILPSISDIRLDMSIMPPIIWPCSIIC